MKRRHPKKEEENEEEENEEEEEEEEEMGRQTGDLDKNRKQISGGRN